jgi:hypothetical protein
VRRRLEELLSGDDTCDHRRGGSRSREGGVREPCSGSGSDGQEGDVERPLEAFAEAARALFDVRGVDCAGNRAPQFGVVAVRSGAKALAFPIRNEGGTWKIETPGPVTFQLLGPLPGSNSSVSQVGVEVHAPRPVDDAIVWIDGKLIRPTLATSGNRATVFANLQSSLPKGTHIAVVYAQAGNDASAEAWAFSASG